MEKRVALLGVIVEQESAVETLNELLHDYRRYIIGRMGVPYHARGINIISIVLDAPSDEISSLAGKVGAMDGMSAKVVYSKMPEAAQ